MTAPNIEVDARVEVAPGVHVVPDPGVLLIPNAGVVVGERAALVVDTGLGPVNGERLLRAARSLAGDRKLYLTLTHFHPEHGFGAQAFAGQATILYNAAQADELAEKGAGYLEMFRTLDPDVAEALEAVELIGPDISYAERATLDLGGLTVELVDHGRGHSRGDQVVFVRERGVLFTGDLVENRWLPIFPPEGDADGERWLSVLERLEALGPRIVVPGHGDVGGVELIGEYRDYLRYVRQRVDEIAAEKAFDGDANDALEAEIAQRYADWQNHEWIRSAIEGFQRIRGA